MLRNRLLFVVITFSSITQLCAQTTRNWTGAINTDWHTPGNWDTGVPQTGDDVIIDVLNTGVFIDNTVAIRSLRISQGFVSLGSTMTIDQKNLMLVNFGDGIRIDGPQANASLTIAANGILNVVNAADDAIEYGGLLSNNGLIKIETCTNGIYDGGNSGAGFINNGKLDIRPTTSGGYAINAFIGSFTNERCGIIIVSNHIGIGTNKGSIISLSEDNLITSEITINQVGAVVHWLSLQPIDITTNSGIFDTNPNAIYWTGCQDEFWSSDNSWSRGFDPREGDSVIINQNSIIAPQLASTTNSILHLRNEDVFNIQAGGRLNIDGNSATSQTVGLQNLNRVVNNGFINVSNTNSDGINNQWEFTNNGGITVNDATFAAIQDTDPTHPFLNNEEGAIFINSPLSNGIQAAFGGSLVNHGLMAVNSSRDGLVLWENNDQDTRFDNFGRLQLFGSNSAILVYEGTGLPEPTFHNHQCAHLISGNIFNFNFESEYINEGYIAYSAPPSVIAAVTNYVDIGFQYDPFENLLDDNSKILSAPVNFNDFTTPDPTSAVTFCEGNETCIIQRSEIHYASATYEARDIINGEGAIQGGISVILKSPTTNLFQEFTVDSDGTLEIFTNGCTIPD